jgi:asparagine synthase (glutamine-hydrolysing)
MCGILGSINKIVDRELLQLIKHRGPDGQDIWHETYNCNNLYLAHTRLSILDLSEAGNQPMVSQCGNYVLIFNGEIYNHLELRAGLSFKNLKGHSDTETLLYYLIENGVNGIKNLNGIFAFAFWNRITGEMMLVRDKFGVKPLYYYQDDKHFVFSSEIRPIRKFVPGHLDKKALSILLSLRYVPSPYTLFQDIFKLRPGHYMIINIENNRLKSQIFNYDNTHHVTYSKLSFSEAIVEYGKKLNNAVERQIMSDVDLGVLLSGGVDSALVANAISKVSNKKIQAFTVGFDSKYTVNELDLAARTAKLFGMEHNTVKISPDSFFDIFEECSRIVEEPLATTSFIPMYYLSKLASEKVKVVLTGQGADEPLGGYGRYQGEILHEKIPLSARRLISILIKLSRTKKESLLRGANSLPIDDDITRFLYTYSLFSPDEIVKMQGGNNIMLAQDLILYYYNSLNCSEYKTSTERMMAIDQRMDLVDDLLLYTDKITMNFSMECRVPFLDHALVEFIDSLPLKYKVVRGNGKIIHKAYAESVLPVDIINRPKFGFQSPTDIWFRELFDEIESILVGSSSKLIDYFDKNEIKKILNKHKSGYNKEKQIFLLLSLNYWLENI